MHGAGKVNILWNRAMLCVFYYRFKNKFCLCSYNTRKFTKIETG